MDVDRLLRLNGRPMLQLADFVLDDPSAAEDALEQAFVAAWRQRKGLKDEAVFRPWLRRIVLRECLRLRRHPVFRVLAITDRVVVQATASATSDAAAAVKRLSQSDRAIIFLHLYEGLSLAQVASELRVRESSVKTRLRQITGLESGILLLYTTERASQISDNQADVLVSRALARSRRRGWSRYLVNVASAVTLALVIIATGIVLQAQLHLFATRAPSESSSGSLPPIPNEVVNLITASGDSRLVMPFRLRDSDFRAPRSQAIVAPGVALHLTPALDCSVTTVRLVDPISQNDVLSEVALPGCIDTPVILPDGTVLLDQAQSPTANYFRSGTHTIRYDWRTGRIVKQYPNLALPLNGGLVSKDGQILYTLDLFSANSTVDFTDLASGAQIAHIAAGPIVRFADANIGAGSAGPWWLPAMSDAQAAVDTGRGIAVDPRGRWVAAVGFNDPQLRGIWLVGTSTRLHLIRRFYQSGALTALAFSLDGGVLYALDVTGLIIFDPETGRIVKRFTYPAAIGAYGIAGVQAP